MKLLATWRRSDGSLVQFSETGWRSTDPEKNEWLVKMSELYSTAPVIPPVIRMWLEEYCELIRLKVRRICSITSNPGLSENWETRL
jgi:hypothetical protein